MTTEQQFHWGKRLRASGIHLLFSAAVASIAAALVFGLWYPAPYREFSGGRELFLILTSVDVVLGPLLTLAVFNLAKPRDELIRDLIIVVLIQLAALGYGLWTVLAARPVHLVFEFDRFRVVHAIEIPEELLSHAPRGIRGLPLTGPTLLAVRPFRDVSEESSATLLALEGLPLSARPDFWQDYSDARQRVLNVAKPIAQLRLRFAAQAAEIDLAIARAGRSEDKLLYLPMNTRKAFWTVLIDAETAEPRAFLPLDTF